MDYVENNKETIITMTTEITAEAGTAYADGDQALGTTNYEIIRDLTKTEQAQPDRKPEAG